MNPHLINFVDTLSVNLEFSAGLHLNSKVTVKETAVNPHLVLKVICQHRHLMRYSSSCLMLGHPVCTGVPVLSVPEVLPSTSPCPWAQKSFFRPRTHFAAFAPYQSTRVSEKLSKGNFSGYCLRDRSLSPSFHNPPIPIVTIFFQSPRGIIPKVGEWLVGHSSVLKSTFLIMFFQRLCICWDSSSFQGFKTFEKQSQGKTLTIHILVFCLPSLTMAVSTKSQDVGIGELWQGRNLANISRYFLVIFFTCIYSYVEM